MLCANLCVTCGTWYVLCSVLYARCADPFMIYPFCYVARLKPFILCLKNPFVRFNSFITWAKIALSMSIFVASGLLCCNCKIIHLCSRLYVALADSPFDLWVIFRHDISLGSNFYKVPYELNIRGTDFHKSILYFFSLCHRRWGGAVVERWSGEP